MSLSREFCNNEARSFVRMKAIVVHHLYRKVLVQPAYGIIVQLLDSREAMG